MKKTFSININGLLFNIDEDAFEKLSTYLRNLKKHFIGTEGGEDIVNDIEARIAELFKEQLKDHLSIVTLKDVDNVIHTLGQPFEMDEEISSASAKKKARSHHKKRIFRDLDNNMLAGVAAGLAAYFFVDSLIIRLLFILSVFMGGVGIIIYITLWVLTPVANTTAEKLEMEGEKVDIHSIEKKVTQELSVLKDRFKDFTNEAGDLINEAGNLIKTKTIKSGRTASRFGEVVHDSLRVLFRTLGIIIGIVFLIVGIALSISFAAVYMGFTPAFHFDNFTIEALSFPNFLNTYIFSTPYVLILNLALALVILIPVVALIYSGIRLIFNLRAIKFLSIIATVIWAIALSMAVTLSLKTLEEFKTESKEIKTISLNTIQNDTIKLFIYNQQYYKELRENSTSSIFFQNDELILGSNNVFFGNPGLTFDKSDGTGFELHIRNSARGAYATDAKERLLNTKYHFEIKDNSIYIDPFFSLINDEKWRDQEINFTLLIPTGKTLYVDKEVNHYFKWNYWKQSRRSVVGNYWIMTEEGLKNLSPSE